MNEKLINIKNRIVDFWKVRTMLQKGLMIGSVVSIFAVVIIVSIFASKPNLVPLPYSNLTPQEVGQIKANLEGKGIKFEVTEGGTKILIPEEMRETLLVDLAAEGIPDNGQIDNSFFGQNAGWGITENEFNVLKVEAMNNELAKLIEGIDGVEKAQVIITLPEESVWVKDDGEEASASIVIKQKLGYKFKENQINGLYHLISKSVPNLPIDNIVVMNQNFEHLEVKKNEENENGFANQYAVKKEIEKDIERRIQQMLGMMMGRDKVAVSVTADIDFTKEVQSQQLVEPVDKENMEGITISAERITETYNGRGVIPGGTPGTGQPDPPAYNEAAMGDGEYERIEEVINNEVNKIQKEIVKSPYSIRDLGIQVIVDPTTGYEEVEKGKQEPVLLDEQKQEALRNDIQQMLSTVIRTSINPEYQDQETEFNDKISITMQPFNGRTDMNNVETKIPLWVYIAGGVALLIIGLLIFLIVRKRKAQAEEVVIEEIIEEEIPDVPDLNQERLTELGQKRKQLEKMAQDKPDEFAKLLRTWLAED